jgi:hypothetical protein
LPVVVSQCGVVPVQTPGSAVQTWHVLTSVLPESSSHFVLPEKQFPSDEQPQTFVPRHAWPLLLLEQSPVMSHSVHVFATHPSCVAPHVFGHMTIALQLSVAGPHALPLQAVPFGVQQTPAPSHSLFVMHVKPAGCGSWTFAPALHVSAVHSLPSSIGSSSSTSLAIVSSPGQTRVLQSPGVCIGESPEVKSTPQMLFSQVRVAHSGSLPQSDG